MSWRGGEAFWAREEPLFKSPVGWPCPARRPSQANSGGLYSRRKSGHPGKSRPRCVRDGASEEAFAAGDRDTEGRERTIMTHSQGRSCRPW